ncbi:DUF2637 domain-containing protein [Actinopolymorpha sp. B11F2]|uniref:DUF2637 domain-containing protein n=1 Tax=Actinopolymorpha sp. B11F2 TaxID=3160862 RepID=UPI0032E4C4C2
MATLTRPTTPPRDDDRQVSNGHTPNVGQIVDPPALVSTHEGPSAGEAVSPSGQPAGQASGQPSGARMVAWSAFLLGVAASVAANVAHAQPQAGPRIAAAFVPLALLLAVECMSRPRWHRTGTWWGLARYGGTGLVALVAAVMSYRHMRSLLISYGEDTLNAAIGPLAVDGLMVVAGFALLAMNHPTPKETS